MEKTILLIAVGAVAYVSYKAGKIIGENTHVSELRRKLEELTKDRA
jgi:hypothetical protein